VAGCLLLLLLGIFLVLVAVVGSLGGVGTIETGGNRIALIRVDGVIVAGQSGFSLLGNVVTGSDDIVDQLEQAIADGDVRGILLRINSPGGSAAGAQEIYRAIERAREADKPIVASMADVAASGGYYVAAPCTAIYADPATLTGSIGVISIHQDLSGLYEKIGVDTQIIKSGKLKDMFQPSEPLSPEAREVATAIVEQVFAQFVDAVVKGRNMKREDVVALADGRVYTGEQAKANGLIDDLGGMHEALLHVGKLAGIQGTPMVKEYGPSSLLKRLFGGSGSSVTRTVDLTGGLMYDEFAAKLVQGGLQPEAAAVPRDQSTQ